jgi:hypothetical protein
LTLYFPESCSNTFDFKFSPNEDKQSDFLAPILNGEEAEEKKEKKLYNIYKIL